MHIVEAEQKPPYGGFPGPRGSDNGNRLPALYVDINAFEDHTFGLIAKDHIAQLDMALVDLNGLGIWLVFDLCRLFQQIKHLAHVHKSLTDLAIDRAKEVQRHGDLHHIGVDHHKIAHRQRAVFNPNSRHDHNNHKARRDDERLPNIQPREGIGRLQRRALIAFHRDVIPRRFALLGAKILHGFKVQQAVDGLLVCIRVLIIHLFAQLHAPFGDLEGEPNIERDRHHDDQQVPSVQLIGENAHDQHKLQHQRPDREQQKPQEKLDAFDTPLDDPA